MTHVGTELELISNRIKRGIRNGRFTVGELKDSLSRRAKRAASQTDYYVHENAWTVIGAAAAAAFLGGWVLTRKKADQVAGELPDPTVPLKTKPNISVPEVIQCAIPLAILLLRVTRSRRIKV